MATHPPGPVDIDVPKFLHEDETIWPRSDLQAAHRVRAGRERGLVRICEEAAQRRLFWFVID